MHMDQSWDPAIRWKAVFRQGALTLTPFAPNSTALHFELHQSHQAPRAELHSQGYLASNDYSFDQNLVMHEGLRALCTCSRQSQQCLKLTTPSPGQPNKIAEDATAPAMTSGNRILLYAAKAPPENTNDYWYTVTAVTLVTLPGFACRGTLYCL